METGNYLYAAIVLVGILLAILGGGFILRWVSDRFGLARLGQGRRLGIVEVTAVDPRRRLVLVRRDNTEHLILLGHQEATVVERGIPAPATTEGR